MQKFLAKTFKGLEQVLAKELDTLGAKNIVILNRAVGFDGDLTTLYQANLWLRTALNILVPIEEFKVRNETELYRKVKSIKWEKFIDVENTFSIHPVVHSKFFKHSKYVALKSKDALVDRFRDEFGARPSVDTSNPDLKINVHIAHDKCTVSLDSSGLSLNKRGYRVGNVEAPLNEVLAAGLIALSGWNQKEDLTDPFCGSGTILIEAAMLSYNIAPGINRSFGFEKWANFDLSLLKKLKEEAKKSELKVAPQFFGSDILDKNVRTTAKNIFSAGLGGKIKIQQADFTTLSSSTSKGTIITNPPYGERLKPENIHSFYRKIGDNLKHSFQNHSAWILSSNINALKHLGLKTSKRLEIYNGALPCKFFKYEMYAGSKKIPVS